MTKWLGSYVTKWLHKSSGRKVDKHPTLNSAPTRSVIKRGNPGLGPWAWSRTRPGPVRVSYLHGSASVCKSRVGLQA